MYKNIEENLSQNKLNLLDVSFKSRFKSKIERQ